MKESLIIKFLNGACTEEERKEILHWLSDERSQAEFDVILKRHWKLAGSHKDIHAQNRVLKNIHSHISAKPVRVKPLSILSPLRVAASFVLIAFASYVIFQTYLNQVIPEANEKSFSQEIVERTTGIGQKLTLKMVDGSIITLNGDSKIAFASEFGRSHRQVILEGEAYFEVEKDTALSFEVLSGEILTRALGTEFNVFARDNEVRVSLNSGSVKVEDTVKAVVLRPGEQASTEPGFRSTSWRVGSFDIRAVTGWKEGKLIYKQPTALGTILSDLERWYGVEMSIDHTIDLSKKVYGTFSNGNLSDILNGLGFSLGFSYNIDGKNVKIKSKTPM